MSLFQYSNISLLLQSLQSRQCTLKHSSSVYHIQFFWSFYLIQVFFLKTFNITLFRTIQFKMYLSINASFEDRENHLTFAIGFFFFLISFFSSFKCMMNILLGLKKYFNLQVKKGKERRFCPIIEYEEG